MSLSSSLRAIRGPSDGQNERRGVSKSETWGILLGIELTGEFRLGSDGVSMRTRSIDRKPWPNECPLNRGNSTPSVEPIDMGLGVGVAWGVDGNPARPPQQPASTQSMLLQSVSRGEGHCHSIHRKR